MNRGTEICRTLKSIRKRIAEMNGIDYTPAVCPHEEECVSGTCPACEEELRFLEKELEKKKRKGDFIAIDGVCTDTVLLECEIKQDSIFDL